MQVTMTIGFARTGTAGRMAALAVLYAFVVKTLLVLAMPLASTTPHGVSGAPGFATQLTGAILCLPSADGGAVDATSPERAPTHDVGCCLSHCLAQLAVVAPLALLALLLWLRPPALAVWPPSRRIDQRQVGVLHFWSRGPPALA